MPIIISDNMEPRVPKPLDGRLEVATYEILETITYKYDTITVWVISEQEHYRWSQVTDEWSIVNLGQLDVINGGYF